MDFHEVLKIAGGAGTLAMFIPMAVEILRRGTAGQSFSTWFLWALLDTILSASTILKHGNYLLPLGYALGGWCLTGLLLAKGRFAWGRLDSVVLALVIGCLAGWGLGGAKTAIISATSATCAATIPGLVELWREPLRAVGNVWAGFMLANAVSFLGGTAMTVEERFTPAVFTILSGLMVVASRRQIFVARRSTPPNLDTGKDRR
jgi:hypothetical protein